MTKPDAVSVVEERKQEQKGAPVSDGEVEGGAAQERGQTHVSESVPDGIVGVLED